MNRTRQVPRAKLRQALGQPTLPGGFQMPRKHDGCGKRRCATYEQAVGYVLWLARRSKDPLRIYPCPDCSGYHVTKRRTWEDPTP